MTGKGTVKKLRDKLLTLRVNSELLAKAMEKYKARVPNFRLKFDRGSGNLEAWYTFADMVEALITDYLARPADWPLLL
jgi:hypothetical protein